MKKILALILVLCCVFTLPIFPIFALENIEGTGYDITTSDVMEDLNRTYIDGKQFNAADYPLNASVDYLLLLNVIEYAWDDYSAGGDSSAYGLYFYFYNPSGDDPLTRGAHQVQMSVAKTDFYVKYLVKLVSASEDNRFLKFMLESPSSVFNRLWSDTRTYKISGIEIETKAKGVRDYKIAGTYTFTGRQASKTLSCSTDTLTTIELDLHSTYYRLDSSAKGKYYYSQLDSVYFALDDWILEEYGEVYSISFQYSKRLFNTLVSWDEIASNIGWEVANGYNSIHHVADYAAVSYFGNMLSPYFGWRWEGLLGNVSNKDFIMAGFYVDNKDVYLSPDELLAYAYENDMFSKAENHNAAFSPVFKRDEITIEDNLKLLSIQSNYNWAQQLLKYGLFGGVWGAQDSVDVTEPIYHVKPEDLEAENFSEKLYVDPHDVDEFKNYVSASQDNNKSVYLFRFQTQDYYAMPMHFFDKTDAVKFPVYLPPSGSLVDGFEGNVVGVQNGYYTEQYMYQDFDILSMTFRDESNNLTILPVVSDPIDIIGGNKNPGLNNGGGSNSDDGNFGSWKRIVAIVMIVLVVILVIWLLSKILPKRVKVVNRSGRRRRR